jgi:hypothetical protein
MSSVLSSSFEKIVEISNSLPKFSRHTNRPIDDEEITLAYYHRCRGKTLDEVATLLNRGRTRLAKKIQEKYGKEKINERRTQEVRERYSFTRNGDRTRYEWKNIKTGEILTKTCFQMGELIGECEYFSRIVSGAVSHYKCWKLNDEKPVLHQQGIVFRLSHPKFGTIEGTQKELIEKAKYFTVLSPAGVCGVVNKKAPQTKGYVLEAVYENEKWVNTQYVKPEKTPYKHSQETKDKIAKKAIGRMVSVATRETMSASHLGKKMPEGTGNKISLKLKGKPKSEEHKQKLRKPKSDITKQKLRDAWAKRKSKKSQ